MTRRTVFYFSLLLLTLLASCGESNDYQANQRREAEDNNNSHDIVEALKADTNLFRDGAEQNDDLTILAFRYT